MPRQNPNARRPGGRSSSRGPDFMGTPWAQSDRPVPRVLVQPVQRSLQIEAASGIVLVVAAAVALVWANSPAQDSYVRLFEEAHLVLDLGWLRFDESVGRWINDLLMALFFFVVGLEVERELVHGDLQDPRAALLPLACAVGGMVVPALLSTALNAGGPGARAWGIPMATGRGCGGASGGPCQPDRGRPRSGWANRTWRRADRVRRHERAGTWRASRMWLT